MWSQTHLWLATALFGVAPGWLLLRAAGLGWSRTEALAAAPGLSLAVVAALAYLAEALSLPVAPWTVLALLAAALIAVGALRGRRGSGLVATRERAAMDRWPSLLLFGSAVAAFLLLRSLRSTVVLPPTIDDGVHHATWIRLIHDLQTLSPSAIYAPPVSADAPNYYPWGWHAWSAMLFGSTSLPFEEIYWQSVLFIGACLPLGVYVLARRLLPGSWPAVAAAVLSLGFYWLPFQPYLWGGYALVAGTAAALPLARLAPEALESRSWPALGLVTLCGAGLLLVHPSQALAALLMAGLLLLPSIAARRLSYRALWPFVGAVALLGLVLVMGPAHWPALAEFVGRADELARAKGAEHRPLTFWLASLYLGRHGSIPMLGLLTALGVLTGLMRPRWRMALVLHAGLLTLAALADARSWLTTLWYYDLERIWYLQVAAAPPLAAAGLGALVDVVRKLPWWRSASSARRDLPWAAALAAIVAASHGYYEQRIPNELARAAATTPTEPDFLKDFEWIRRHIPKDALVLTAPGDWGLVLPYTGRMTTFSRCQARRLPHRYLWAHQALIDVGTYDRSRHLRVHAMGIGYVYAATFPSFDVVTPPRSSLDIRALDASPGLELIYQSTTARIYRVRDRLDPALTDVPLHAESPATFRGFYGPEYFRNRLTRWSSGHGIIEIPAELVPGTSRCHLLLGLWRLSADPVEVSFNGQPLVEAASGLYPLAHVLQIGSPTFRPVDVEDASNDTRTLGVAVRQIAVTCRRDPTSWGPVQTARLPLDDAAGVAYAGFYPVERDGPLAWRWTKGTGRVKIDAAAIPKGHRCTVKLELLREPTSPPEIRWDGVKLAPSAPGLFPIDTREGSHTIEIVSSTFRYRGGQRPLGVALSHVGFHCPSALLGATMDTTSRDAPER